MPKSLSRTRQWRASGRKSTPGPRKVLGFRAVITQSLSQLSDSDTHVMYCRSLSTWQLPVFRKAMSVGAELATLYFTFNIYYLSGILINHCVVPGKLLLYVGTLIGRRRRQCSLIADLGDLFECFLTTNETRFRSHSVLPVSISGRQLERCSPRGITTWSRLK